MLINQIALNTLVEMPDLLELAMATHTRDTEKAVQDAISRATLQLGDTELRPRKDLAIRRFLQRKGFSFAFLPSLTSCWRGSRPPLSVAQVLVSSLVSLAV